MVVDWWTRCSEAEVDDVDKSMLFTGGEQKNGATDS